jgi:S-formylglutathione hydrolase FrmB
VHVVQHASAALEGNPWGDPSVRDVFVYTPPGWKPGATGGPDGAGLPAVLMLPGYAGTGEKLLARGLSDYSIATRIDELVRDGCPPFVAVMPDVMTRLGGSQYVDSAGIGKYATWLAEELTTWIDGTIGTNGRWGVVGKSSGGFGAIHLALDHPGRFQAVACHSGDLGFDLCYSADLIPALRAWAGAGGPEKFVDAFWQKPDPGGTDFAGLNLLAMSRAYGGEPVDWQTGEVRWDVLRSWSAFDPVVRDVEALRQLELLYVDVGDRDEHGLQFGARRFVRRLSQLGIDFVYEEFPGGHRNTAHRYSISLPQVARTLATS